MSIGKVMLVGDKKQTVYRDDEYIAIKDEFEQIRQNIGVYIGRAGTDGAFHLFKEVLHNAFDECSNPKSPADKIVIVFDESECSFVVEDNGRGIPFDKIKEVCMEKHTSSKFSINRTEDWDRYMAGKHGVGLTVACALTSYFSITSYRGFESKTLEFINGEVQDHDVKKLKKEVHGTIVKLIPSNKYLGEEESINITVDMVENFLRKMSYIMRPTIKKIEFYFTKGENEPIEKRIYTNIGLSANVDFISPKAEIMPVEISVTNKKFDLSIAFTYDKTIDTMVVESYCNYIYTSEKGTHEDAAQRAVCEFLTREAKKLDPNSKYEVTFDDCRKGLVLCVNCWHINPAFEGQHKSKVSNKDIFIDGKKMLVGGLQEYFNNNNATLRKIITYLRQMSRIRQEANKIKGVTTKRPTTFLEDAEIKKFTNVSDRNYQGYTELLIAEGDSACSSILSSRNAKHQAVFSIQGVVSNTLDKSLTKLLQTTTFRDLIKILGCGVGKDFNINKFRWNKVILCNDSDADGKYISSLLLCFFIMFLPELVNAGKIFIAVPPLYLIDIKKSKAYYKGKEWIHDKNDYYRVYNEVIAKHCEIRFVTNGKKKEPMSYKETLKWLENNSEYLIELENLSRKTSCNPLILEYICYYKKISKSDTEFKTLIEKKFDELTYNIRDNSLYGSYNGEYVSIIIDTLFERMAKRYEDIAYKDSTIEIEINSIKGSKADWNKLTIGEFLSMMQKNYNLDIINRFKGLGDMQSYDLFATTINPKTRKLIKVYISDLDEARKVFEMLHSKSNDMIEERRKMLAESTFSFADIDN